MNMSMLSLRFRAVDEIWRRRALPVESQQGVQPTAAVRKDQFVRTTYPAGQEVALYAETDPKCVKAGGKPTVSYYPVESETETGRKTYRACGPGPMRVTREQFERQFEPTDEKAVYIPINCTMG
jgi:hypothetical protein